MVAAEAASRTEAFLETGRRRLSSVFSGLFFCLEHGLEEGSYVMTVAAYVILAVFALLERWDTRSGRSSGALWEQYTMERRRLH